MIFKPRLPGNDPFNKINAGDKMPFCIINSDNTQPEGQHLSISEYLFNKGLKND